MSASTAPSPTSQLLDAHRSERLGAYLRELWGRRSYIGYVSSSELRSRQVNTVLGNLWHLLNPALSIAVYYLIFGVLLGIDRGVDNFILFLTVGVFMFQYTQRSTMHGASSVVTNVGLLRAFRFPRAMLPVTTTVTESIASLNTFAIMYAVALLTGQGPRWQWLLIPFLLVLQFFFNMGAAMVAARATTHFRDITQILPFFFRLLLYGSGVIFNVASYASGANEALFTLNPMYCFITIARWCVMGGEVSLTLLTSATIWSIALCVFGFWWFRAAEERYGRD